MIVATIDVLSDASAVADRSEAVGRLSCMNCGRDLCEVIGDETITLDRAVLTCPSGAPPPLHLSASVVRCGRCGGRVMFEYG